MNTLDINISVVLGVANFKKKNVHLLFRSKWGEGVGIIVILFFFVRVSTRLFDCSHRPVVSLSIIVKCNVNHLGQGERDRKWKVTFNQ